MLLFQLCCVPHCKHDLPLSPDANATSAMACVVYSKSILTAPYHTSTSLSFHISPHRGEGNTFNPSAQSLKLFGMSFKAVLTSWAAAVTNGIRPRPGLGPALGGAWVSLQPNPPTWIIPKPRGRLWLGWRKKNQNGSNVTVLQRQITQGWNPSLSLTDPVHAANKYKYII